MFNNLDTFAYCIFLNRIYIVNYIKQISASMIDLELKQIYKIELEGENAEIEICRNHSFVFIDTKLIFTGGINKLGKVSNAITSFDIATYKFENEKVRENNMVARHSHGSIAIMDYIYIIGGFSNEKNENSDENNSGNILNIIQLIKYDSLMNSWLELTVEGSKPEMMIKPQILIVKDQYLLAFSSYKYYKIWFLNLKSNFGTNVDLTKLSLNSNVSNNNLNSIVFSTEEDEGDSNISTFGLTYINLIKYSDEVSISNCKFSLEIFK